MYPSITPYLFGIFFHDDMNGFGVSSLYLSDKKYYKDVISMTSDGGETWRKVLDTLESSYNGLQSIHFYDRKNGIALGSFYKLWKTTDSGISWHRDMKYNFQSTDDYLIDAVLLNEKDILGVTVDGGHIYKYYDDITSFKDNSRHYDVGIRLFPNPLPAGSELTLEFSQQLAGNISIELMDMLGRRLSEAFSGFYEAGRHTLRYKSPQGLPSGVYFLSVSAGSDVWTKKVIIIGN